MNLYQLPTPEPRPSAEQKAEAMMVYLQSHAQTRFAYHVRAFQEFWDSPETPDELLEALNKLILDLPGGGKSPASAILLGFAGENLEHLTKMAGAIGLTLTDFIPKELFMPRRQFIPNPDGTISLAPPAEGYDAWGRLIPVIEEEIIDEEEPPAE